MLFFFQAEDGIRDVAVTGVQTCALPIWVMELAKPFRMSQPAISKHLKVLERAGLIVRSRRAQSRPCRLEARPLREVADWTERYRRYASGAGGDGPPGPKMATRAAAPALCWAPWRAFRDSTRRR